MPFVIFTSSGLFELRCTWQSKFISRPHLGKIHGFYPWYHQGVNTTGSQTKCWKASHLRQHKLTALYINRHSLTLCKGKSTEIRDHVTPQSLQVYLRELAFAISFVSFGSSHTLFLPHFITADASRFCNRSVLQYKHNSEYMSYPFTYSQHWIIGLGGEVWYVWCTLKNWNDWFDFEPCIACTQQIKSTTYLVGLLS